MGMNLINVYLKVSCLGLPHAVIQPMIDRWGWDVKMMNNNNDNNNNNDTVFLVEEHGCQTTRCNKLPPVHIFVPSAYEVPGVWCVRPFDILNELGSVGVCGR